MRRGILDGVARGASILAWLGASILPSRARAQTGPAPTPINATPPLAADPSADAAPVFSAPSAATSAPVSTEAGGSASEPPPPPDAPLEPTKRVQDNFVPDVLRLPRIDASIDFSLLARSSPRSVDGNMREAAARGFRFDEASVPIGPGGLMLGASAGVSLISADRWIFPAISFDFVHSVGSRPSLLSARAATIVSSKTWTTYQVGVTVLGVGVRGKHRRWAGSLVFEPGFLLQVTSVRAPVYEGVAEGIATAASPRFQLAASGCRRLDPTLRLCLSVTPHVYALGFLNGFTLGFRTEIGP